MHDQERRQELADFLKTRRARLSPAQVGLPEGGRRRTPGLRREELALLAGMSSTWYTWLEQGRPIRVSVEVLHSLARTLKLNLDEQAYLLRLALPEQEEPPQETVSPALWRVLTGLDPVPAYIRGQRWDMLAWNRATCVLLGPCCQWTEWQHNLIWNLFLDERYRHLYLDWEGHARAMLAQFRASAGTQISTFWFRDLIEELRTHSPRFRRWWSEHDVLGTPEGRKDIRHPQAGLMAFEHATFIASTAPTLQLVLNIPLPEHETAHKLALLLEHAPVCGKPPCCQAWSRKQEEGEEEQ